MNLQVVLLRIKQVTDACGATENTRMRESQMFSSRAFIVDFHNGNFHHKLDVVSCLRVVRPTHKESYIQNNQVMTDPLICRGPAHGQFHQKSTKPSCSKHSDIAIKIKISPSSQPCHESSIRVQWPRNHTHLDLIFDVRALTYSTLHKGTSFNKLGASEMPP